MCVPTVLCCYLFHSARALTQRHLRWFQVRITCIYVYTVSGWAEPAAQSYNVCAMGVYQEQKKIRDVTRHTASQIREHVYL